MDTMVEDGQNSVALAKEVMEYFVTEDIISSICTDCYRIDSVNQANDGEGAMSKGHKWILDQTVIATITAWGEMWLYVFRAFEWSGKIPYEDVNTFCICSGFVHMILIMHFCWGANPTPKAFKLYLPFLGTGRVMFSVYFGFGPMWRRMHDNHTLAAKFLMQMAAGQNTLIFESPLYGALVGLAFKERLCYGNMQSRILTMVIRSLLFGHLPGGVVDGEKFIILIIRIARVVVFVLGKFTFVDYDKFCQSVDYGKFCHLVAALIGLSFILNLHASGKEDLASDSFSCDYSKHLGMETIGGIIITALDSNLEDKVLIEEGRNVTNKIKIENTFRMMSNMFGTPGKCL